MNAQEAWRLEESEVQLVAASRWRPGTPVSVVSILCNWGAPVSGRYDPDFLDIWVVADDSLNPSAIVLHGCSTGSEGTSGSRWLDIGEFVKIETADINGRSVGLYHYSGPPVDEFVVRLTDHRGSHHYDNNGGYGVNYRLRRYHGFQLNCVRTSIRAAANSTDPADWILVFPGLVGLRGAGGIAQVSLD